MSTNFVIQLLKITLILSGILTTAFGQNYAIKFDTLNASYFFGGDNSQQNHRNVAVAQSIFINQPIKLRRFAFYFTTDFDSVINPTGGGHEVTLKLHIRDSLGTILKTKDVIVPDTFTGGWVSWNGINLDLNQVGKYIFSTYLVGGYDSNQVHSGHGCDQYAGYPDGERYTKIVVNDSDAAVWGDWFEHSWDSNFWLTGTTLITDAHEQQSIVDKFNLEQNYPNPFNPTTKISWHSSVGSWQSLKVYDVLGNEVAILVDEYKPAGTYKVEFNASNLPSGVYFYQLQAGEFLDTKKLLITK